MSGLSPAWIVRKSAVNYTVALNGSFISLKPNGFSEAEIVFDNTVDEFNTIFAAEDEVEIYIGSVIAANKMMDGYIDDLVDIRTPGRKKELKLHITNWGDYLAGKTVFEKDFTKTKTASNVFSDAAAEIAGLSTNIIGLNTASENMKRRFNGTYVKDAWAAAAENAGADYFVDETKTLQAFAHNSQNLIETGSGLIYKIRDIAPVTSDHLMLMHTRPYQFDRSARDRYRTVIATNGIKETYPVDIDLYQTAKFKEDENGKTFSAFYTTTFADFDIDTTINLPVQFLPTTDVGGGLVMPTIRVLVASSGQNASMLLRGIEFTDDGTAKLLQNIGLVPTDWQRVAFFIKNARSGTTMTAFNMRLYDDAANHWSRNILADINSTNFTYIAYDLPADLVSSPSNGWTKTGSPTVINRVGFEPVPATGWTAKTYVEFGKFHFFRRRRATVTGGGSPATEKIIIDSTMKSINSLTTLATKEQARANQIFNSGFCTIEGNNAFKKPAFNIQVDFTATLGSGRSATVRLEELRHKLVNGRHDTEIFFKPAFARA